MNKQIVLTVILGIGTSILASMIWESYKAAKTQNYTLGNTDYFDQQFKILGKIGSGLYAYTPPNVLFDSTGVLH